MPLYFNVGKVHRLGGNARNSGGAEAFCSPTNGISVRFTSDLRPICFMLILLIKFLKLSKQNYAS